MTELQNKELQIFRKFVEICETLELPYFMVCGTALGAAKYKGFIPWDDDIDIGMLRKDYEVFLNKAPKLLEHPYFLQNYYSDKNFPMFYSKLRDSSTTYIERSSAQLDINHGVYIDIFPLDGYPTDYTEQKILNRKKNFYSFLLFSAYDLQRRFPARVLTGLARIFGCHHRTAKLAAKITQIISAYSVEHSEKICNHGNWQGNLEYAPKEQYGHGTWTIFEGIQVRIPEKYDEYLTQKYGNWRADLPEEERVGHHYYEVCDLTRPYTDYIERLSNGKIKVKTKKA